MERVGQVTRSASALIVAKLVTSVLSFLLAIVVNRNLGPQKAGIYVYAMALYIIFQVIPDFGLGNIFIRDVSPDQSRLREYLENIVVMRLGLGVISVVLLMFANVASTLLQHSDPLAGQRFWAVFVISFSLLLEQPFSNSMAEAFIALERQMTVAAVYLIMGFIRVALALYIILSGANHAIVLLVATYLVTILYSIGHFYWSYHRWVRRHEPGAADVAPGQTPGQEAEAGEAEPLLEEGVVATAADPVLGEGVIAAAVEPEHPESERVVAPKGKLDFNLWRYLLRSSWPLAIASAGVVIYAGMDIPLVSWIAGDKAVGLYNAGAMYCKSISFLLIAVNMALLPAISIVASKRPENLAELWRRLLRYALALVLPLSVIVPVLARPVLILQKHEYLQAWKVVWITMGAVNFTILTTISYLFFIVLDKQKKVVYIVFFGVVAKAVINVVTISLWGYTGAAVTLLVTEILGFCLVYYMLSREMDARISWSKFALAPLLTAGALYGTAFLLQKLFISHRTFTHAVLGSVSYAILIAAIIVVIYAGLAFATGVLSKSGLNELNELLKVE